jgi:hypothetical protein
LRRRADREDEPPPLPVQSVVTGRRERVEEDADAGDDRRGSRVVDLKRMRERRCSATDTIPTRR